MQAISGFLFLIESELCYQYSLKHKISVSVSTQEMYDFRDNVRYVLRFQEITKYQGYPALYCQNYNFACLLKAFKIQVFSLHILVFKHSVSIQFVVSLENGACMFHLNI